MPAVSVEAWGAWVFVNLDPEAEPLAERSALPIEDHRLDAGAADVQDQGLRSAHGSIRGKVSTGSSGSSSR